MRLPQRSAPVIRRVRTAKIANRNEPAYLGGLSSSVRPSQFDDMDCDACYVLPEPDRSDCLDMCE